MGHMCTKRVFLVYLKFEFIEGPVFYLATLRAIQAEKDKGTLVKEKKTRKTLKIILRFIMLFQNKEQNPKLLLIAFLKSRN